VSAKSCLFDTIVSVPLQIVGQTSASIIPHFTNHASPPVEGKRLMQVKEKQYENVPGK
jgi:hypothetical protein